MNILARITRGILNKMLRREVSVNIEENTDPVLHAEDPTNSTLEDKDEGRVFFF